MIAVTLLVCIIAVVYDCKYRVIPNRLVLPYLVLGLAFSLARHDYNVVLVLLLGFLFCEILFRFKMLGGGDLKLLLGITVTEGAVFGFWTFFFSLLAALPLFAIYMLKEKSRQVSVPYAVAILAGVIATCYWEGRFSLL